jgi:integrase
VPGPPPEVDERGGVVGEGPRPLADLTGTIALGPRVADELFEHRARSAYQGDDERVFMSPHRGTPLNPKRYADTFPEALAKAEITDYVRPYHDGRHSQITNAAAGTNPAALMARSGHSDFKTTQLYIDLAGETFRPEAELLEARLSGAPETPSGTRNGYKAADLSPVEKTKTPPERGFLE